MIFKCWRIPISINIYKYIYIHTHIYINIISLFLFLILICRDFLPEINFEGSDLAWERKQKTLYILQYRRRGSERKYFLKKHFCKNQKLLFLIYLKFGLKNAVSDKWPCVAKQISGWGSVLGVSVCKMIEAKSVVMLVNDLKTECNT